MGDGFDVSVEEVRAHAATVAGISDEVAATRPAAQVGGDAFGMIATFFASAVTSAGDQVGDAITRGAQSVMGVHTGLGAVADVYQRIEEAIAQRFRGDDATPAAEQAKPQGQRAKAVAVLEKISKDHPTSVATVALRPVRTFHRWAGDIASAEIGDHYEKDVPHLLKLPPTDANLRLLADTETKFWESDRGNWVGAAMSADQRYSILRDARDEWLTEMSPADRDRIAKELGVQP